MMFQIDFEALFAELKNQIGLRRLRLRRLKFVRGAVPAGRRCAKHKATGALPRFTDKTDPASHRLAVRSKKRCGMDTHKRKKVFYKVTFSTATGVYAKNPSEGEHHQTNTR